MRIVLLALGALLGGLAGVLTAAISPLVGFAALAAILLGLGMLLSTQVGLLAFLGIAYLLPFGVIPIPIGGIKLTFIDASLTLLLLVWLAATLAKPERRLITTPLDGLVLLFIGLAVTSFFLGIYSVTAEVARFFLKTINSILFFFTITNCLREKRQIIQVTLAIPLFGLAAAALALFLYILPASTAEQLLRGLHVVGYPTMGILRYIASTTTLRAIGTSIDPNILGGMLLLALPLTLSLLFASPYPRRRGLLAAAALGMLLALILTYSRSSWIGAVGGILFLATTRYRRLWVVMILFLAVLYFLPEGDLIFGRIESGIAIEDRAAQMRLGEYKDALRLISLYPWFGVGFGSAPSVDLYIAASSIYLLIAEQMGLIGLGAFLLLLGVLFFYAFRRAHQILDPELRSIQGGALAGLVGALTAGIFDHYFFNLHFPHTVALFWLFVGLVAVSTRLGSTPE